jgi:hypothetical protein
MIQSGRSSRFTLEPLQGHPIGSQSIGQELQGDVAPKSQVLGFVHHTHTTATQLLEDAVMRNGSA